LPLNPGADQTIWDHLTLIKNGERVPLIVIGEFTAKQFAEINAGRVALDLHELAENQIVFIGKHLYESRTGDGTP
jgi:tagatose-1,6-bisphosphate aldolase non-catalytic subunit AgaZ/GatZ